MGTPEDPQSTELRAAIPLFVPEIGVHVICSLEPLCHFCFSALKSLRWVFLRNNREIVPLLRDNPETQRRVAMKATETAVRPCLMIVSYCIDLGTAPFSSENGRFPFFRPHFAMTLLVREKLSRRHRSISVNGACSFVRMAGQDPNKHSQYFMKKAFHHPFFLSRLVLSFYLITAQSLLLFLLQASFTFFPVSSGGSRPDCSCPPFQCHCQVSVRVSRPCVCAQIPAV